MRTSEERMDLIFQRTEEIQKEQQRKKQRWLEAGCVAACLVLVVSLGLVMPGLMDQAVDGSVMHNSGAASLIASQSQLGYIVVGIFSFFLGSITTTLLYRVKEHRRKDTEMKS